MEEDCSWNPDIVKIEPGLSTSDEECSADVPMAERMRNISEIPHAGSVEQDSIVSPCSVFIKTEPDTAEGFCHEFVCEAESASMPEQNQFVQDNIDLNSDNDFQSEDDLVPDSIPLMKVEVIEDGSSSTDASTDERLRSIPEMPFPAVVEQGSANSLSSVFIKTEPDVAEDFSEDDGISCFPEIETNLIPENESFKGNFVYSEPNFISNFVGEKKINVTLDAAEESDPLAMKTPFMCIERTGITTSELSAKLNSDVINQSSSQSSLQSTGPITSGEVQSGSLAVQSNVKPFYCDRCSARLRCKSELKVHILSVHCDVKCFSCDQCSAKFKSKASLNKHVLRLHLNNRPFSCEQCSTSFHYNWELQRHVATVHSNERPFSCEQCPQRFKSENMLKVHSIKHRASEMEQDQPTHSDEKPFSCENCPTRFKSNAQLKHHILRIHSERPLSCEKCSARFVCKFDLNRHSRTVHADEKRFPCEKCPARFKSKVELTRHLFRFHSDEKPFACEKCSTRFKSNSELKQHIFRVHSDEKPFACETCPTRFKTRTLLKQHVLRFHSDEKPFPCEKCSAQFTSQFDLNRHFTVHSNEKRFSCLACSTRFKWKHDLKRHILKNHS